MSLGVKGGWSENMQKKFEKKTKRTWENFK